MDLNRATVGNARRYVFHHPGEDPLGCLMLPEPRQRELASRKRQRHWSRSCSADVQPGEQPARSQLPRSDRRAGGDSADHYRREPAAGAVRGSRAHAGRADADPVADDDEWPASFLRWSPPCVRRGADRPRSALSAARRRAESPRACGLCRPAVEWLRRICSSSRLARRHYRFYLGTHRLYFSGVLRVRRRCRHSGSDCAGRQAC